MPRDIFHPLSDLEREEKLRAFGEFLKARDGAPDLAKRTLSGREEQLQRFQKAQALYPGVVNRALFEAQYRRFDKRVPTPKEISFFSPSSSSTIPRPIRSRSRLLPWSKA